MKQLKNIFLRASQAGVASISNKLLSEKILLTNRIAITIAAITFPYLFIFYFAGSALLSSLIIFVVTPFLLVPYFNTLGKYTSSRVLLCVTPNVAVSLYSLAVGKDSGIQLYYFVNICLPLLVFTPKDLKYIVIGILIPILLYLYMELVGFSSPPWEIIDDNVQRYIHVSMIISTFLSLVAGILYFYFANHQSQKLLLDSVNETITQKQKAESANQAKTEFLAMMSHEIRTPLGIILGYAELISNQEESKKNSEEIDAIIKGANHLNNLITSILDISSIESRKIKVNISSISLKDELADLTNQFKVRAKEKGIDLQLKFENHDIDQFCTDLTKIRQILTNLLSNSIKFSTMGSIQIIVQSTSRNSSNPKCLQIDVVDCGQGIPPQIIGKIFKPFTSINKSVSDTSGGVGLGLYLSKRLANLIDGDLTLVKSKPFEETRFRLFLKDLTDKKSSKANAVELNEKTPIKFSPSTLKSKRILIVEDNLNIRRLLELTINKYGGQTILASDGEAGVEMANSHNPDFVIMDIQLPKLNGFEATKAIRQSGYINPIICLSAHAFLEHREKAKEAGCNVFLEKPVQHNLLLSEITRLI